MITLFKRFFSFLVKQVVKSTILLLTASIIVVIVLVVISPQKNSLPDKFTLIIDINDLADTDQCKGIDALIENKKCFTLQQVTSTLKHAESNDKVTDVIINFKNQKSNLSNYQSLAYAIQSIAQKKSVTVYSENYNLHAYLAGSGASKIILHPTGYLEMKGLGFQLLYFNTLLKSLGLEVEPIRAGKYKSAVEPFILDSMTVENKYQLTQLSNGIWQGIKSLIIENRKLKKNILDDIANTKGYLMPNEALEYGLVDSLGFYNDLVGDIEDYADLNSYMEYYQEEINPVFDQKIAVLVLDGSIGNTSADDNINANLVIENLKEITSDSTIKALVLRINSPGGSAQESETIFRELQKLKIPFYVSMGQVAASGGYYIAMGSQKIFAQNTTITGSIGVYGMMINMGKLNQKIGISYQKVSTHNLSSFPSLDRPFTDLERERLQLGVDSIYELFLNRVATSRKLSRDSVFSLAQGRVWCGVDAKKVGLIDEIGDLNTTINYVKNQQKNIDYSIVYYPKQKGFIEDLKTSLGSAEMKIKLPNYLQEVVNYSYDLNQIMQHNSIQMRLPYQIKID
jgi:protease-4